MELFSVAGGEGLYRVEIAAAVCGADLSVTICGGSLHHVGAAALGVPRPSLKDPQKRSASESVLCVVGHKDDEVAKAAAHRLASEFGCVVSVSAGLHLDNAGQDDIQGLVAGYEEALAALEEELRRRGFSR